MPFVRVIALPGFGPFGVHALAPSKDTQYG